MNPRKARRASRRETAQDLVREEMTEHAEEVKKARGRARPAVPAASPESTTHAKPSASKPATVPKPRKTSDAEATLREMLVSVDANETRVAVLEDRRLVELYVQRGGGHSVVGNIYLGKVKDILPGMEASFVDVGLKRNAFLYVDEVLAPDLDHDERTERPKRIQEMLKAGQSVLVQVTKDPMGTKGARVTAHVSLPGRYLVLIPHADFVGISRRLDEQCRERLHALCEGIKPKGMGVIARTAAEDADLDELTADLGSLTRLWKKIQRRSKTVTAPELLYADLDLPQRMVRDDFTERFQRLVIDHQPTYALVVEAMKSTQPSLAKRVGLHKEKMPLFAKYGIEEQMEAALARRVWLRSGGYITIDRTEALTAIDVNTGKYVGKRSLEETITKTNLEAAVEVPRQLRLRDIGGIIVVDFIDMDVSENRQRVLDALTEACAQDRTKCRVVEIGELGLVHMTRKNVTDGLPEVLTDVCPTCGGSGRVTSDETLRIRVERAIVSLCVTHRSAAFLLAVHPKSLDLLLEPGNNRLAAVRQETGKFISLTADPSLDAGEVRLVMEGKVPQVERHIDDAERG